MTLEDLAGALPHGFHDGFLNQLAVDYVQHTAELELEIWTGDLRSSDRDFREAYQAGRLSLRGLVALRLDVPNGECLGEQNNGLWIDLLRSSDRGPAAWLSEPLPEGAFAASFVFTDEYNSHLNLAASEAEWEWLSEPRCIY